MKSRISFTQRSCNKRGLSPNPNGCLPTFTAQNSRHRAWFFPSFGNGLISLLLLLATLPAYSTSFAQVMEVERQTIAQAAASQRKVDALDDETARLNNDYSNAIKQQENLEKYHAQLRGTIQSQLAEQESLRAQLARISHLERDIVPLMSDMLDALAEFIRLDLPFQLAEREQRIKTLRSIMVAAGTSNSEKYRRILEAYQIENDYGRTLEAWDASLDSTAPNESASVTFLKVGRVGYFYLTQDGNQAFTWSRNASGWQPLDKQHNKQISQAIKMAREQVPFDLLMLPIVKTVLADAPEVSNDSVASHAINF